MMPVLRTGWATVASILLGVVNGRFISVWFVGTGMEPG